MFKSKRAQIAIADLFIALFVATILIIVIISTWNAYVKVLEDDVGYKEMQIIAFQAADLLVKSGGEPADWENDPDNVYTMGLASSDRELSPEKVSAFVNDITLGNASLALGVGFYDFYFRLRHINGTVLEEFGPSSIPNRSIINVPRVVSYKNEKAIMEFALWK